MRLSDEIIISAVNGCPFAVQCVIMHYERYINALATITFLDKNGAVRRFVDQDIKSELMIELIKLIPKYDLYRGKSK